VLQGFSIHCAPATAQKTIRVDSQEPEYRIYLPLSQKDAGRAKSIRHNDWALVALPAAAGIMLLGKRRR
jgi:hypothetical protein